jgi:hypothetical protein
MQTSAINNNTLKYQGIILIKKICIDINTYPMLIYYIITGL